MKNNIFFEFFIKKFSLLKDLHPKARLLPLKGKYYGTEVEVKFLNGKKTGFSIWVNNSYVPSEREVVRCGYTMDQYKKNEMVDNGWKGKCTVKEAMDICDDHFESAESFELANFIVESINNL